MSPKRTLAALLASVTLALPLASCSGNSGDTDIPADTTAQTAETIAAVTSAETDRSASKDNIPADFTMNGATVNVILRSSLREYDFDGKGEETGDVIYDAVYRRTRSVEDRLKLKFEVTSQAGGYKEFGTLLEQEIMAGDDTWQIAYATSNATIAYGLDYLFKDLANSKYLDFEQPWWWKNAMETISIDGKKIRYLVGDLCLYNFLKAGAMYFNKDILESNGYKADDLYKTVLDRKWTYDKLREMSQTVYRDLNGDGVVNTGDLYGFLLSSHETIQYMEFTVGVRHSTRNEKGYPVMDYDTERAEKAISTLNALIYETKGIAYIQDTALDNIFAEEKSAFYAMALAGALSASFRDMKTDFGVIPYPMLDEAQGEYATNIHNSASSVAVPITCKNSDEIGAVIEAMCSESYRSVVEPFYETALKSKYSRDSYSSQCVDIIRNVAVKDFMYEYNGVVGGGRMIREQVVKNTNNFASAYAAQLAATNQKITDLVETYNKMEADLNS